MESEVALQTSNVIQDITLFYKVASVVETLVGRCVESAFSRESFNLSTAARRLINTDSSKQNNSTLSRRGPVSHPQPSSLRDTNRTSSQAFDYEAMANDLAEARQEVHRLEAQVEAMAEVQQQMHQAKWFNECSQQNASLRLVNALHSQPLRNIKAYLSHKEWITLRMMLKQVTLRHSSVQTSSSKADKDTIGSLSPITVKDRSPRISPQAKRLSCLEDTIREQEAEIEDLRAHVSTHASTKQALVKKLTQVEMALNHSMALRDQAQAQISSDKQVLFYLDRQVHTLESRAKAQEVAAKEAETRSAAYKRQISALVDEKRRWITTHRLLDAEIGSLRAQVAQSESDRREAALRRKNKTEER